MKASELREGDLLWRPEKGTWVTVRRRAEYVSGGGTLITFRYGPAHPNYPLDFCFFLDPDAEVEVRRDEDTKTSRFE